MKEIKEYFKRVENLAKRINEMKRGSGTLNATIGNLKIKTTIDKIN